MERVEGYVTPSFKAARIVRLLAADRALRRARRIASLILALATVAYLALVVLFLTRGPLVTNGTSLLSCGIVLAAAFVVVFLALFICGCLYGGEKDPTRRTELVTAYIRSLLCDTLLPYRTRLLSLENGAALYKDAHEYAAHFALVAEERDRLLKNGALKREGEAIRRRYEGFLREITEGDEDERGRYLKLRANMMRVIEKWKRMHLPAYAEPQRALIEYNISLIKQSVTNEREKFMKDLGATVYMDLLHDVLVYRDPSKGGEARLIPTKERFRSFCDVVARLEKISHSEIGRMLNGALLDDCEMLIAAYDEYEVQYSTVGAPTIDIKRCRSMYESARKDTVRCWSCKTEFHPRFRETCSRCKHYVCPKCGRCYCEKHIVHKLGRVTHEDQ